MATTGAWPAGHSHYTKKRTRPPEQPRPPWRPAIFGRRYASCAWDDAAIINSPPEGSGGWEGREAPPRRSDNGRPGRAGVLTRAIAIGPHHDTMAIAGRLTGALTNGWAAAPTRRPVIRWPPCRRLLCLMQAPARLGGLGHVMSDKTSGQRPPATHLSLGGGCDAAHIQPYHHGFVCRGEGGGQRKVPTGGAQGRGEGACRDNANTDNRIKIRFFLFRLVWYVPSHRRAHRYGPLPLGRRIIERPPHRSFPPFPSLPSTSPFSKQTNAKLFLQIFLTHSREITHTHTHRHTLNHTHSPTRHRETLFLPTLHPPPT